jgi:predicted nucleic acid-binding Zn ribbon protein
VPERPGATPEDALSKSAASADEAEDRDAVARLALERAREAARAKGLYRSGAPRRRAGTAATGSQAGADDDGPGDDETTAPRRWRPGPGLGYGISGPGPSRRDPQSLGGIAERMLAQRGWRVPLSVGGVVGRWREVVGDQIADHCHVETFEEGALVLRTTSTAWATQVRLLLPQLERRLAEEVGEGTVTSVTVLGPGGPSWKHGYRSVRGRGPRDTYG